MNDLRSPLNAYLFGLLLELLLLVLLFLGLQKLVLVLLALLVKEERVAVVDANAVGRLHRQAEI